MYVRFEKRIWDIVIGLIALPFVLLIIAVLAPLIKLEDGGPVFYNAARVGKDGVDFKMYKLRSMRVNAPDLIMEDGSTYNGADDPRMTKIGAFMRKTSLDEMPQFFNVLLGDMSVVGPRPDLRRETELYEGEEGLNYLSEYSDSNTERGKRLRETICEKFGFASLEFQSLEGVIEAIGVDKCKLCTYCWDGRE